jgi:hypothetical protein
MILFLFLYQRAFSCYFSNFFNSKALSIICDDELGFTNNDIKNIFDHYRTEDIEDICLDLWKCWESPKIISKQGYFRGRLKQLNNHKTQNNDLF